MRDKAYVGCLLRAMLVAPFLAAPVWAQTPDQDGVGAPAVATPPPMAVNGAQASYSLGLTFGTQLKNGGLADQIAIDSLVQGVKSGLAGEQATQADKQRVMVFMRSAREAIGAENRAAAAEFLAKNAKEAGIKTTPSGLQYKVITAGDESARSPRLNDQVTVHYRGTLLNGNEFDSSYKRGVPTTFTLGALIKGWNEALLMMKPGAHWQLFVPPQLGYDNSPPGSNIPPGSLLIFEMELIKNNRSVLGNEVPNPKAARPKPAPEKVK